MSAHSIIISGFIWYPVVNFNGIHKFSSWFRNLAHFEAIDDFKFENNNIHKIISIIYLLSLINDIC